MFLRVVVLPLFAFLSVFCSVLVSRLADAPVVFVSDLAPALIFTGSVLFIYVVMRIFRYGGDLGLPCLVMTLCGLGTSLRMRVGFVVSFEHMMFSQWALPIGVAVMAAAYVAGRRGRVKKLEPFWLHLLIVSALVIGFVLVMGRRYRGAVYLPGNMNPVEVVKPLLIIAISSILAGHSMLLRRGVLGVPTPPANILLTVAILWLPPMAMLVAQGDLGMFALMNATLVVMLYAATKRIAYLFGGFAAIVALARVVIPLTLRGRQRWNAWMDPFSVATGAAWQPLQGLVGLYSGGLFGTGIGAGAPTVVPIVASDFIYVVVGEELGFAGCMLVVLLYLAFTITGLRVSSKASGVYESTVATGITACIALQALLNIGGVTTAIPLTGIPLPFLSHGGSSLVTTLFMTGLLMAISDQSPKEVSSKRKLTRKKSRKASAPEQRRRHIKPFDDSQSETSGNGVL